MKKITIEWFLDDPLAAKIRLQLKKRKIDFDSEECVNPCSEEDPMKKMIVNSSAGVYIPCISSYEKPVTSLMTKEDSMKSKVDMMVMMVVV